MNSPNISTLSKSTYIECNWTYQSNPKSHYGYSSVMQSLQSVAKEKEDSGETEQADILNLLSRAASMMMTPASINEPFKPSFRDFQAGRRSAIPDDFTQEELNFFAEIIGDINEPWLKARLADVLWLCNQPKNPEHARIAIDAYIVHEIGSDTWRRDVDNCWHRAARLCLQIRDTEKLDEIKKNIFLAFDKNYPDCVFMSLWLAEFLDEINLDKDYREDIALKLFTVGDDLAKQGEYSSSRSYLELAAKKCNQIGGQQDWLDCLILSAELHEKEAATRSSGSQMVANSFYENAIQAYRRVPVKHRAGRDIETKIQEVRAKISESGQAALGEMGLVKTPGVDISDTVKASIEHVSSKGGIEIALLYFTGLDSGPNIESLTGHAKASMQESIIGSIAGAVHRAADGRVVAKTPCINFNAGDDDPDNKAVLNRQIQQQFSIETQLIVEGQILPALHQMLMEYRFTLPILEALCYHSLFVPVNREKLVAYALWLGFERDFANAIHLLSPQFEHCIRCKLKDAGAHTSNVDRDGIENENGLSTLMDLPEALTVFGKDFVFEIKAIFTDAIGPNLRNEVAHGLLDDNASASVASIYAWWMILRLIVRSLPIQTEEPIVTNQQESE